jgi:PAS domain S-box-containing protein
LRAIKCVLRAGRHGVLALFSKNAITPEEDAQLDSLSSSTAQAIRAAEAEEAMRESEARMRAITDSAQDAIVMIDPLGKVSFWNPGAERIFGYKQDEMVGQDLHNLIAPERYRNAHFAAFSGFRQTGSGNAVGKTIELAALHKDGHEFPVDLSLSALKINDEWCAVGIIRDISERKRTEEQMRFQSSVLENLSDSITVSDVNFAITFMNKTGEQLYGYTLDEIKGKMPDIFNAEPMAAQIQQELYRIVSSGKTYLGESLNRRKDGSTFHCEYKVMPLKDSDGKIVAYVGLQRDITERKLAEAVLARTVSRFTAMIDTVHAELYLKNRDNTYIAVNRAFANKTGLQPKQIIGKRDHEIFPSIEAERYFTSDQEIMKNNIEVINKLEEIRGSDGKAKWVESTKTPLVDMEGAVTGIVGMIRDVTALYLSRQQLAQADKLAAIGTLAAGVAHEINNPIGYISSNLNTLGKYILKVKVHLEKHIAANDEEAGEIKEILDDCTSAITESLEGTSRVKKIVMDLKSFSRIDRAEKEFANINEGIESTLNIVWNELKYKCKVEKQLGQLPELFCMPNQLNQVFMNLLVNAGQAITNDKGSIVIKTWADQGNIFISIKDNGSGIPKENLNKIYEAFFTTKEVGKGTGLGLSLVYDIIKKHNGKIEVDSTVGVGTEFVITLPIEGGING